MSSLSLIFRPMRPNILLALSSQDARWPAHRSPLCLSLCACVGLEDENIGIVLDNLRMLRTKKPEFCVEKDG